MSFASTSLPKGVSVLIKTKQTLTSLEIKRFFIAMNCEKSTDCGFYLHLVEQGIVQKGVSCIKTEPEECPRYQFANGKNIEKSQSVFKVKDVHTESLPISRYEIEILFPKEERVSV